MDTDHTPPITFVVRPGSNDNADEREMFDKHPDDHFEAVPDPLHPSRRTLKCKAIPGCEACEICCKLQEIRSFIGYDCGPVPNAEAWDIIWSLSDGMGPGYDGGDWSAIRDSSNAAIRAMYNAIHA